MMNDIKSPYLNPLLNPSINVMKLAFRSHAVQAAVEVPALSRPPQIISSQRIRERLVTMQLSKGAGIAGGAKSENWVRTMRKVKMVRFT
jgi:hypothetical protein